MAQRASRPPAKAAPKPHLPPTRQKLAQLPPTAKVTKRPLLRPAFPSPYANASAQKTVYVSARTPFLSAVKRVEKLLELSDKRLVQAATTLATIKGSRKRKRAGAGDGGQDVEAAAGEAVVIKGTGKAVSRVLGMALWFQQREERYKVSLKTGSVGAVDDVAMPENHGTTRDARGRADGEDMEVDAQTRIRHVSVLEVYVTLR
ncbi:hypothetical protein EJ03DRAFT_313142 [Teratosphaeria nubilosa]|uniref:Uncharacterized protein n=1 Tax=Teratosphaeria nubilosa TaxID=161662 RepID=A0A6G1LA14_9PEZI|nr:hypothetical protein EJ03DRAFT_313142 [Teratosphaeria nubilosa]